MEFKAEHRTIINAVTLFLWITLLNMDRRLNILSTTFLNQFGEVVNFKNYFLTSLFQMNMKTGKGWVDVGNAMMADGFFQAAMVVSY